MYLTTNFGFKPLDPQKILKQYAKVNANLPSASQVDRASILAYMEGKPLTALSHATTYKGKVRSPVTGLAVLKDTSTEGFPSRHVSYLASAPVKSPLAQSGAVDDLATHLMDTLSGEGVFEMHPNNAISRKIYQDKLGLSLLGQGTTRGIRLARRKTRG